MNGVGLIQYVGGHLDGLHATITVKDGYHWYTPYNGRWQGDYRRDGDCMVFCGWVLRESCKGK
jgi:hypothetical protein